MEEPLRGFTMTENALENVFRRHAQHDLTDRLVVQYAPLALLRDCVDVAQTAFERIFLEHRHRAASGSVDRGPSRRVPRSFPTLRPPPREGNSAQTATSPRTERRGSGRRCS